MSEQDMKALADKKLDLIERENPAYEPIMLKVLEDALTSASLIRIGKGEVREWLNSFLNNK